MIPTLYMPDDLPTDIGCANDNGVFVPYASVENRMRINAILGLEDQN